MKEKDAYYFPHDSNAHNDPKMLELRLRLGFEGIGIYWTIIEILRDTPGYKYPSENNCLARLELRLSLAKATLEAWLKPALEVGLLVQKDGFLYSESLLRRMERIDKRRAALSAAGRRGGRLKPGLSHPKARLKPPLSSKSNQIKSKNIAASPLKSSQRDGEKQKANPNCEHCHGTGEARGTRCLTCFGY